MTRRRLIWVPLILLCIGCDSQESDPVLGGTYQGTLIFQGVAANIQMTLTQSGERVTGTGTVETISFTVEGTHQWPEVQLVVRSTGFLDSTISATASDEGRRLRGTWIDPTAGTGQIDVER